MQRQLAARVGVDVGHVEPVLEKERHEDAGRGHDARRERGVGAPRGGERAHIAAVRPDIEDDRSEA